MRPMGEYIYFLNDDKGYNIGHVKSGVQIKKNDELNWRGNKLFVLHVENSLLTVKKLGNAIVVK